MDKQNPGREKCSPTHGFIESTSVTTKGTASPVRLDCVTELTRASCQAYTTHDLHNTNISTRRSINIIPSPHETCFLTSSPIVAGNTLCAGSPLACLTRRRQKMSGKPRRIIHSHVSNVCFSFSFQVKMYS